MLSRDLNKLELRPQKSLAKVVQDIVRIDENPSALTEVRVPSYTEHVLVRGPLYSDIKVAVVSGGLDAKMSGVMVLAVKLGTKDIDTYHTTLMSKTYTIKGQFGFATDNHDADGKIWQKSTFDHVTQEKFERVISNMQRSHQKVMLSNSGVDIQSQEAYELATRGLLRPFGVNIPPLILDMRCTQFKPPDFELVPLPTQETDIAACCTTQQLNR
ncbi:mitochondrial mRNA pseudouridine synthase Trub2-like isoform X3 [Patiria miniata]|uniref:Pseudouridine synthase II N-terminal domain-containing protein n=1 Tax=Patiria miniata TaxID=46514 RepID=A0A913Z313_PATMI|nr:mitochondrial mRNA pseudouridine synthase Trub2-like isoform X3 [Patiria miniata]